MVRKHPIPPKHLNNRSLLLHIHLPLRQAPQRPSPHACILRLNHQALAVWHATGREIASHCGADAAQFLIIEGGSFVVVFSIGALSTGVLLPLNVHGGSQVINDEFSKTTINHIKKGSSFLWIHFVFVVFVVLLVHFGMSLIEKRLKVTRFRDGNGNLSDPNANSTAAFTIMVQGLPKSIGDDRRVLQEYFQYRYPGKIL
ncbi:hypothetical protein NC652_018253 [Populus alba x Populus x berolinensis]|nr:hypothetical protein NC652_018253 [Populus alba x Populus x berolinensis]